MDVLPKAIDQQILPLISKEEGLYKLYESPKDLVEYITWRN